MTRTERRSQANAEARATRREYDPTLTNEEKMNYDYKAAKALREALVAIDKEIEAEAATETKKSWWNRSVTITNPWYATLMATAAIQAAKGATILAEYL